MKAPSTSIGAVEQKSPSTTAPNHSRTTEAHSRDCSKTIKRTMAAEYSRELSAKVFAGQAKLTELGFRQGGLRDTVFGVCWWTRRGNPSASWRAVKERALRLTGSF